MRHLDEGFAMINSMNYSKRQMEYIYQPVEKVTNPTKRQLHNLLDKAELIKDYYTFNHIIEKWGKWVAAN